MKEWFEGLETRERWVLVIGSIIAVISILYGGIISPLYGAVDKHQASVREHTQLLQWIQANQGRATTRGNGGGGGGGSAVTELSRQVRSAGLQPYLEQSRPNGNNGVRAEFRNAPFDELMKLLGNLESGASLRVVDAAVQPGDIPGTGNFRVTLARAGS
ncbi:MAG: type II secretion system protein GspM [Pseudomonadota bacterium]